MKKTNTHHEGEYVIYHDELHELAAVKAVRERQETEEQIKVRKCK